MEDILISLVACRLRQRVEEGRRSQKTYFALVYAVLETFLVHQGGNDPIVWPVFMWQLSEIVKNGIANQISLGVTTSLRKCHRRTIIEL